MSMKYFWLFYAILGVGATWATALADKPGKYWMSATALTLSTMCFFRNFIKEPE